MRPGRAVDARRLARLVEDLEERLHDVDRHGEDDGRILFGADLGEGLQIAQLHRGGNAAEDFRGVDEGLRGLEFGLGVDHLGAAVAFGFGLLGDRPHHVFGELDGPDLDIADLDAPGLGLGVEDALHVGAELLALGQHLVEFVLAEHRAQRGLGEHVGRRQIVLDPDDRAFRVDHVEIEHRVDLHRDIVARDHVLARDFDHFDAQVDADHLLDERQQQHQPRPLDPLETAEREHDRALVFPEDAHRSREQHDEDDRRERQDIEFEGQHGGAPSWLGTAPARPCATGSAARAPGRRSRAAIDEPQLARSGVGAAGSGSTPARAGTRERDARSKDKTSRWITRRRRSCVAADACRAGAPG